MLGRHTRRARRRGGSSKQGFPMCVGSWWWGRVAMVAVFGCGAVPRAQAQAPVELVTRLGVVWRYLGDTIWYQRDTTARRSIYRGDTVFETESVNGQLRYARTYVLRRDGATLVASTDS